MWASIRAQERALWSRFKVNLSEFWVIIFFEQAEPQSEGSRDTDLGIKLLPELQMRAQHEQAEARGACPLPFELGSSGGGTVSRDPIQLDPRIIIILFYGCTGSTWPLGAEPCPGQPAGHPNWPARWRFAVGGGVWWLCDSTSAADPASPVHRGG